MRVGILGLNGGVMIVDVIFRIRGTTVPTHHRRVRRILALAGQVTRRILRIATGFAAIRP